MEGFESSFLVVRGGLAFEVLGSGSVPRLVFGVQAQYTKLSTLFWREVL